MPSVLGALSDADPIGRRRSLLLAAALLLAVAIAAGAVAGAWQLFRRDAAPLLDLAPPTDLPALVLSTYDRMPQVPPMTIAAVDSDGTTSRIYVDRSGAVRVERQASPDATEREALTIYRGTSMGRLAAVGTDEVWVEQADAISEDPRVFLLAELEGPGAGIAPGCGATRNEGEVGNGTAAAGWSYVGPESVIGRPVYHVTCAGGDLWIDAETRLILRSRGPARDGAFEPIPGSSRTVEVTALEFGEQPAALFELAPPPGVAELSPEAYQCQLDPAACEQQPQPEPSPATARGSMPPVTPTDATNGWIAYSTDGRQPGSTDDATGSDLYLIREGDEPILVAGREAGTVRNTCPSFSPDGSRLAYGTTSETSQAVVVREIGQQGVAGDPVRIAIDGHPSGVCPRWSADGSHLAYVQGDHVVVRGLDGSTRTGIDGDPRLEDFELERAYEAPVPSPSGDRTARLDVGACQVVIETLDGSAVQVIPLEFCPYALPTWSPDGRRLLVMQDVSGHDFTMHAIDAERPNDMAAVVADVRTNGARSWPGWGDVAWQPVVP